MMCLSQQNYSYFFQIISSTVSHLTSTNALLIYSFSKYLLRPHYVRHCSGSWIYRINAVMSQTWKFVLLTLTDNVTAVHRSCITHPVSHS